MDNNTILQQWYLKGQEDHIRTGDKHVTGTLWTLGISWKSLIIFDALDKDRWCVDVSYNASTIRQQSNENILETIDADKVAPYQMFLSTSVILIVKYLDPATVDEILFWSPVLILFKLTSFVSIMFITKLDFCCSALTGVSGLLMQRLQSVLNAASRLVFSVRRSEHTAPLLRELHWLKVPERIQYRLCVLTHRCLHGTAPPYIAETLQLTTEVDARCRLRSASTSTLIVPSTRRLILGDRAFPVAAACAWNTLRSVRSTPSLAGFRQQHFLGFLSITSVQCPCNSLLL